MATAIEASTVRVQTMADGTLRLVLDIEPAQAQAAFRAFGSPGAPVAVARLKTKAEAAAADPEKPNGGRLAQLAGRWCQDARFLHFMRPIYDRMMGGDGSGWGDVAPVTFSDSKRGEHDYCRHVILTICRVKSRADLDHDADAARRFHAEIRIPFMAYLTQVGST